MDVRKGAKRRRERKVGEGVSGMRDKRKAEVDKLVFSVQTWSELTDFVLTSMDAGGRISLPVVTLVMDYAKYYRDELIKEIDGWIDLIKKEFGLTNFCLDYQQAQKPHEIELLQLRLIYRMLSTYVQVERTKHSINKPFVRRTSPRINPSATSSTCSTCSTCSTSEESWNWLPPSIQKLRETPESLLFGADYDDRKNIWSWTPVCEKGVCQYFCILRPMLDTDFRNALAKFDSELSTCMSRNVGYAENQRLTAASRSNMKETFGFPYIRDERGLCENANEFDAVDYASEVYREFLSEPESTKQQLIQAIRSYGLRIDKSCRSPDHPFPFFRYNHVYVDQKIKRGDFVKFLNANHEKMEGEAIQNREGYETLLFASRWFRLAKDQFYWYNRTKCIDQILVSNNVLNRYENELSTFINFKQLCNDPYCLWFVEPNSDGISRPFRIVDTFTIQIPADLTPHLFDPAKFAQKLINIIPSIAR